MDGKEMPYREENVARRHDPTGGESQRYMRYAKWMRCLRQREDNSPRRPVYTPLEGNESRGAYDHAGDDGHGDNQGEPEP